MTQPMTTSEKDTNIIKDSAEFLPKAPTQLEDTGLPIVFVEDLIFKILITKGVLAGRELADELCLPFKIVNPILADLKSRLLLTHRTTAALGDFHYALTEEGKSQGLRAREFSAYAAGCPVLYEEYVGSVHQQTIRNEVVRVEELKQAYADIIIDDEVLDTLGPAVNSGRGLFLFGEPGNGKTTLAERICECYQKYIFIPRALWIDGQVVQLYDPQVHKALPKESDEKYDDRWVKIKRPSIIVGGELTLDSLEITFNPILKVSEAPLQMKANCGVFLIDDFGRQRVDHRELLNRWIIPLEKRYDFLTLANGKKIQVPFDELIIFSTNLDPTEMVDEAFLRRIPYKIEVRNPNVEEFKHLFKFYCERFDMVFNDEAFQYLVATHYDGKRDFRCCQARDLLEQIKNSAMYWGVEPEMTPQLLDNACQNYFAAMNAEQD